MFRMLSSRAFSTKPLVYNGVLINPMNTFFQTENSPKNFFQELREERAKWKNEEQLRAIGENDQRRLVQLASRYDDPKFTQELCLRFMFAKDMDTDEPPNPSLATMEALHNLKALGVRFAAIAKHRYQFNELSTKDHFSFMEFVENGENENEVDLLYDACEKLENQGCFPVLIVADDIWSYQTARNYDLHPLLWGSDVSSLEEIEDVIRGVQ